VKKDDERRILKAARKIEKRRKNITEADFFDEIPTCYSQSRLTSLP
jgi:hypothetical protein